MSRLKVLVPLILLGTILGCSQSMPGDSDPIRQPSPAAERSAAPAKVLDSEEHVGSQTHAPLKPAHKASAPTKTVPVQREASTKSLPAVVEVPAASSAVSAVPEREAEVRGEPAVTNHEAEPASPPVAAAAAPQEIAANPLPPAERVEAATEPPVTPPTPSASPAPSPLQVLASKKIGGQMRIQFGSRDGAAESRDKGSDTYTVSLQSEDRIKIGGVVIREPRVLGRLLGGEKQPLQLRYNLSFRAGPRERSSESKLLGVFPIRESGEYELGGGGDNRLRMQPANSAGFDPRRLLYSGKIQGKSESQRAGGLQEKLRAYSRWIRGKKVRVTAKHVDPLEFRNLVLGAGPALRDSPVTVNGRLDYDYDTGNWFADDLTLSYQVEGRNIRDTITGSIRWTEDPQRRLNGRGKYEFNLRFNERKDADEEAFFAEAQDEEAFFGVDGDVPGVYGSIDYQDFFVSASAKDPVVARSVVDYNLEMRGLSEQQEMNFLKLWFIIIGPMNDE